MAADSLTPYLGLTKPLVNDPEGEDLWGDKLNVNFDKLDAFAATQGQLIEAPQDGKVYGRGTPTNWQEVPLKAEYDTLAASVGQNASAITVLESSVAGKAPLGPSDGNIYGWKGTSWFQLSGSGGFTITWDQVTGKPPTYPPTLPIPSDGVTGLDAKQASQDAAIAAINWNSLSGKPATFPPTLPIPESGVTNLVDDLAARPTEAPTDGQLYSRKGSTASWVVASAGAVVSDTAPTGMPISTIWWNSANGGLFIDYQDPNSRQWVMVNAAGMPEANKDGKAYARKDGAWFDLTASFTAKADKSYVDTQLALKANLSGATFTGEVVTTAPYAYRAIAGNYGTFFLNNGSEFYIMVTNSGDQWGGYNTLRPFYVALATGAVNISSLNVNSRPTWAGVTPWDTGNFNPAAYAPVGGVGGNWIVGSSTLSTDGNHYMPWAGDWLSNVFARYAPVGGVGGNFAIGGQLNVTGYAITALGGSDVQTGTANTAMTSGGTIRRTTSSQDYKTEIEDMQPEAADKVLSLRTVFYRPATSEPDWWSRYGFIAEDCFDTDFRFANCEPETPTKPVIHDINAIVAALLDVVRRQGDRIAALEAGG
ncbi:MAG: hypothetical protein ABW318_21300 [Vicinamibacterales bacterium]